eukprot:TRINITY_DN64363_c0_g1_i1.p3 TRINITY_DN64363_c0_g1~~TRINITY_DN64363_c0_g1_i1.p3  ORF type:complete len:306 (+),score=12.85 TRINITY_DN64363_c0_g1_i1:116-919(+)
MMIIILKQQVKETIAMWLKILLPMLFIAFSDALVKKLTVKLKEETVVLIDAFSFEKGGSYQFGIVSNKPTLQPEIALMVIGKGNNCDTIGKTCTYGVFEIPNLCTGISSWTLDADIVSAHPIMIPSQSYTFSNNTSAVEFYSESWNEYAPASSYPMDTHLNDFVLPAVVDTLSFKVVNITENATNSSIDSLNRTKEINEIWDSPSNYVHKITTNISGTVNETARIYFAIMSCCNETIELGLNCLFLNPQGEQLPLTEIPYKVFQLYN